MSSRRRGHIAAVVALGVVLGWKSASFGGTNDGFRLTVKPRELTNLQLGDTVSLVFEVRGLTTISGTLVRVKYDPTLLAPIAFEEGNLLAGAFGSQFFGQVISTDADGLSTVEGGLTLFDGPVEANEGVLGRMAFEVIRDIPIDGSNVSIVDATINGTNSRDTDTITYEAGKFDIGLVRRFPNKLFDLNVIRKFNGLNFTWLSNLEGIDDKVVLLLLDEETQEPVNSDQPLEFRNPLLDQFNDPSRILDVVRILTSGGVSHLADAETILQALRDADFEIPTLLQDPNFDFAEDINTLRTIKLSTRSHLVLTSDLLNGRSYSYEVTSTTSRGALSQPLRGIARTRKAPNVTRMQITNVSQSSILDPRDSQIVTVFSWFTNRPGDTRILVEGPGAPSDVLIDNEQGTLAHLAVIPGLQPRESYTATISSRLTVADELIGMGFVTEEQALGTRIREFRTPRLKNRRLRFTARPFVNVSNESAIIDLNVNLPSKVWIDYGPVDGGTGKIAGNGSSVLYTATESSQDLLETHSITLSDLEPSTRYRYRISAVLPDLDELASAAKAAGLLQVLNDTLTTDPTGNEPWSRDLKFVTSSADDIFPPAIVEGPLLASLRDRIAVIGVETDVPTIARIFYGTDGDDGTYNTPDEFEIANLNAQGRPRFLLRHYLTMVELEPGTDYSYRLELEAANGQVTTFEPTAAPAGKVARILQPPGGAGSFVTDTNADTQFPVITFGPVNTLNTHDMAVVEWTTDESSDSDGRYGTDSASLEDFTNSGDNVIDHKLTFTNLDANTTYQYVIGSTDPSGNGATESAVSVFSTNPELDLTQPTIESGPAVSYKNDRSATIAWELNETASGEVEFGTTEDLGFVRTVPTATESQEITLTNLEAATTYFYRVSSFDLSNNGPVQSEIMEFTTDAEADITLPVISNVVVTPANSSVLITWETDELADSFVEFGTNAELFDFNVGDANDVLSHELTLTNLTPATTYFGRVGSVDRSGNIAESDIDGGFITLTTADLLPPQVPTNLQATAGSEQVILTWDPSPDTDLSGYNVYRRVGEEDFSLLASRVLEATYTNLGLLNDTTYEYQITAIDRALTPNESEPSELLAVTPVAAAAPATPTGLTRQGEDFLVPTFVFTNSSPINEGGVLTYTIQVSTVADFSNVTAVVSDLAEGFGDVGVGQTAWTIDRSLEEGTTYFWRVRAVEDDLIGEFSAAEEFAAQEELLLPGDFNEDGMVNIFDFFLFVDVFNSVATDETQGFDLNTDGTIDFFDLFVFVDNFGKSLPGKPTPIAAGINRTSVVGLEVVGGTRAHNQLVTVRVWAGPVVDLNAFGFVLNFDPESVEFQEADEGPGHLLGSKGAEAPLFTVLSERPGELTIANGITSGPTVSGQGLLAELTFRVQGSPNDVQFQLADALLASGQGVVERVRQLRSSRLLPTSYFLGSNFPNPFNPSTSIEYALPRAGQVALDVFNIAGQRIRRLVDKSQHAAGIYTVEWDGRDQLGRQAGSGVYFYRLETVGFVKTRKMLLIQ